LLQLIDYFQMSQSHGRDCCFEFDKAIKFVYTKEYLRLPTKADLKSIVVFHRSHCSSCWDVSLLPRPTSYEATIHVDESATCKEETHFAFPPSLIILLFDSEHDNLVTSTI
jgi:hypothetical protein